MIHEKQIKLYKEQLEEQNKFIKKFKNTDGFLLLLIGAVIGAVIGIIITVLPLENNERISKVLDIPLEIFLIALIITVYLSSKLHIIIHEAGHLLFGLITGYRFQSYRVSSLIIYKKEGKIHFGKLKVKGTDGQCLLYPPDKKEDGSYPVVLYNLGGGIANIAISLLVVVIALTTQILIIKTICSTFALMGIMIALFNLIPMNLGVQNDGKNLLSVLKEPYNKEAFYTQIKVNGELSEGKRITEYPNEYFQIPNNCDKTNALVTYVQILEYIRKLALFDIEGARGVLATLEKNVLMRKGYLIDFILAEKFFFMLIDKKPIEEIAVQYKYIRKILRAGSADVSLLRISYLYEAILTDEEKDDIHSLINGKSKKRLKVDKVKLYQTFINAVNNYPVQGVAVIYSELVDLISKKYELN